MISSQLKNSFLTGVAMGSIVLFCSYYSFIHFNELMNSASETLMLKLAPPKLQLIILGLVVVFFRFMMVNWGMEKTAKGLLVTVFSGMIFYFLYHRYKII